MNATAQSRVTARAIGTAVALIAVIATTACTPSRQDLTIASTAPGIAPLPADFALQMVVLQPGLPTTPTSAMEVDGGESAAVAVAVPRRYEHYVYEPTGLLRWDTGERAWAGRFPGFFRRLDQVETESLWTAVDGVMAFHDNLRPIGSLAIEVPPVEGASYLLWWRAWGEERAVRIDTIPAGNPALPAVEGLARWLAGSSWVGVVPARPAPMREPPDVMRE